MTFVVTESCIRCKHARTSWTRWSAEWALGAGLGMHPVPIVQP